MSNRQAIIRHADALWHKLIAYQFSQRCGICGRPGTDPHHWRYHRSILQYRWDLSNGFYMCRRHHGMVDDQNEELLDRISSKYPILWTWSQTRPPLDSRRVSDGHIWDKYIELQATAEKLGIAVKRPPYMPKNFAVGGTQ